MKGQMAAPALLVPIFRRLLSKNQANVHLANPCALVLAALAATAVTVDQATAVTKVVQGAIRNQEVIKYVLPRL